MVVAVHGGPASSPSPPQEPGGNGDRADRGMGKQAAETTYNAQPDDQLRDMSTEEAEALDAWIMGALVLEVPPGFLSARAPLPSG